ncbi:MAG: alpha/beta fold hydrolase, partial [Actinobacteria bacterium]|nr:alpha/beta fold hydrolase [Actinomycetota bacterium]
MATREEKQAYIDEMAEKRGYVLDYHKVMSEYDFDVLQASNNLVNAAYLEQRRLDRKTKELLFIVSLTVMRASKGHIQSHIRVALDLGLSKEEILEALDLERPVVLGCSMGGAIVLELARKHASDIAAVIGLEA